MAWAHKDFEAKMDMGRMGGTFVHEVPQKLGALVAQAVQVIVFQGLQGTVDKEVPLGELQMLVATGKKGVEGVSVFHPQVGLEMVLRFPVEVEMGGSVDL